MSHYRYWSLCCGGGKNVLYYKERYIFEADKKPVRITPGFYCTKCHTRIPREEVEPRPPHVRKKS